MKRIVRIGFGTPPPANAAPNVKLEVSGTSNAVAPATFTLKATASDADGRVVKVVFYNACERIGEASAAPWQLVVPNLAAGKYTFSARAVDGFMA